MSELQKYFCPLALPPEQVTDHPVLPEFEYYEVISVEAARAADKATIAELRQRIEQLEAALRGLRNWAMVTDRGRYIHTPPVALIDPADELLGDHAPVVDVRDLAAADGQEGQKS